MSHLTVSGAYGRDYKSQKEVRAAWAEDKDFQIRNLGSSGYINRSDAKRENVSVMVRYNNDRSIVGVKND